MTIGRFLGDRIVVFTGPVHLVRWGAAFTALGLGSALLVAHPIAGIIGFGCVGIGLSNTVPIIYSAAGKTLGYNPGTAIAAVTTTGYMGLLAGPPLIGLVAESITLTGGLGLVVLACLLVAVFGTVVGNRQPAK
jgi:fucose permease